MSRIRGSNTGLEHRLELLLQRGGLNNYARSPNDIIGKPDFVFRRQRLAIFLDSCFWHGCSKHLRMPKSNLSYWTNKIASNRLRDRRQRRELRKQSWRVIRIWEHELKNPRRVLAKIIRAQTIKRPEAHL